LKYSVHSAFPKILARYPVGNPGNRQKKKANQTLERKVPIEPFMGKFQKFGHAGSIHPLLRERYNPGISNRGFAIRNGNLRNCAPLEPGTVATVFPLRRRLFWAACIARGALTGHTSPSV
jgi:hypothetical protein